MIVSIPDVFSPADAAAMRARLEAATDAWVDGRATAGYQGAPVKKNQQIAEGSADRAGNGRQHHRRARSAIRFSSAPRCRTKRLSAALQPL